MKTHFCVPVFDEHGWCVHGKRKLWRIANAGISQLLCEAREKEIKLEFLINEHDIAVLANGCLGIAEAWLAVDYNG